MIKKYSITLFILFSSLLQGETGIKKLSLKALDSISFEDFHFKEVKLNEKALKALVGISGSFDLNRIKVAVYKPASPFFLPQASEVYINLSSPLHAIISYQQYYANLLTEKHIKFYKSKGKNLEYKVKEIDKRFEEIKQLNKQEIEAYYRKNLISIERLEDLSKKQEQEIKLLNESFKKHYEKSLEKLSDEPQWVKSAKKEISKFKETALEVGDLSKEKVYERYLFRAKFVNKISNSFNFIPQQLFLGIVKFQIDSEIAYFVCSVRYYKRKYVTDTETKEFFTNDVAVRKNKKTFVPLSYAEYTYSNFASKGIFRFPFLMIESDEKVFDKILKRDLYPPKKMIENLFGEQDIPEEINDREIQFIDKFPGVKQ